MFDWSRPGSTADLKPPRYGGQKLRTIETYRGTTGQWPPCSLCVTIPRYCRSFVTVQMEAQYSTLEIARDQAQDHSTLEVEQPDKEAYLANKEPSLLPLHDDGEAIFHGPSGLHEKGASDISKNTKPPLYRRRWCQIASTIITIAVIAAVVGGVVGGVVSHKHNGDSNKTVNQAPQNQTASNTPTSTISSSSPSATPFLSNLASFSYEDENQVTQYRLYHQNSKGMIQESSWNGTDGNWFISNDSLILAKPQTPLAVAKSPTNPGWVSPVLLSYTWD